MFYQSLKKEECENNENPEYVNTMKSPFCIGIIFSYLDYYHQTVSILRSLTVCTFQMTKNLDYLLRSQCQIYSIDKLTFNLAPQRNSVYMSSSSLSFDQLRKQKNITNHEQLKSGLYYNKLILKNWRCSQNDLGLYITSHISKHIGYEQLVFQFDAQGTSSSSDDLSSNELQKQVDQQLQLKQKIKDEQLNQTKSQPVDQFQGYCESLKQNLIKTQNEKQKKLQEIDQNLLKVLKCVRQVHFEYSNEQDFPVKVYILQLILENCKVLKNIERIEFDYVRTADEMHKICMINRNLIDLNFQCKIGVKLMNSIIQSESLNSLLLKAHQITKFFLTINNTDDFKRDYITLKQCAKRFQNLESLVLQVEVPGIKFDLQVFENIFAENKQQKFPQLKSIEVMNKRGLLFEIKSFHQFESLNRASVQFFEIDLLNEYIENQDDLMQENLIRPSKLQKIKPQQQAENEIETPIYQTIPVLINQIQILEIHKGHPLKRNIFSDSIALSNSIKDFKVCFDWQVGPQENLGQIFRVNESIRKFHLVIENYDNNYNLITYIRSNNWIKDLHLDVIFHNGKCYKYDGYKEPEDEQGIPVKSLSRIQNLVLYHGIKIEKARNDLLASFPPQLIGQLINLKKLTILSFLDDELYSQQLLQRIPKVEKIKFKFMNDEPTVSFFLEHLKNFKEYPLKIQKLKFNGGRSFQYQFDQSQICFLLERSKSCPDLKYLEISNQDISNFEKFFVRLMQSNMKRDEKTRLSHFVFNNVNVSLELENDLVFLKHKLPNLLWQNGKGLKYLKFIRKDALNNRSEQSRELFKEAAFQLVSGKAGTGELQEIEI